MSDYKSDAKFSHGDKLRSMGVRRANVTTGLAAAKETAELGRHAKAGNEKAPAVNVTHGKAAAREMAQIEREAKAHK